MATIKNQSCATEVLRSADSFLRMVIMRSLVFSKISALADKCVIDLGCARAGISRIMYV